MNVLLRSNRVDVLDVPHVRHGDRRSAWWEGNRRCMFTTMFHVMPGVVLLVKIICVHCYVAISTAVSIILDCIC